MQRGLAAEEEKSQSPSMNSLANKKKNVIQLRLSTEPEDNKPASPIDRDTIERGRGDRHLELSICLAFRFPCFT